MVSSSWQFSPTPPSYISIKRGLSPSPSSGFRFQESVRKCVCVRACVCGCACVSVCVGACGCVWVPARVCVWKNGLGSQFSDCSLHCSAKAMWVNDNRVGFNSPAAEEEGKSESEIVLVLDRSHMRKTLPLTWKQNWPISFNFLFEYSIQERVHRRGGSSSESSSPSFFNQLGVKPEPQFCPTYYRPSLTWIDQIWVLVSHFC